MWLKLEVRDLRRKVHRMQKRINKYKRRARKSKVVMVEAENEMDPIEQLFEARDYALMAKLQTWKSTVAQYKNEIKRTEERASTTIFG